ncbi:MAG: signal peptide peptidase SppA [Thermodesulfobacteriota bacterium]
MFTRRHPYLFFLLVFTAIVATASVMLSIITAATGQKEMKTGEKVGVVEVSGIILEAKPVLEDLKHFRKAEAVKAIVVRINSPGGAVGPSQEIYREIEKTRKVKPVIGSMGAMAASGGYYVAAATDGIVANPGTITGSIGVIMEYTNFRKLFEKIGLYPVTIKSGKYKNLGSPVREMTEKEETILQAFVDTVHQQFVKDVADGRGLEKAAVAEMADGRILSGERAKAMGLVDRFGNLGDAVDWAGKKGGIEDDVTSVYPPPEKLNILRKLIDVAASEIKSRMQNMEAGSLQGGYVYHPGTGGR